MRPLYDKARQSIEKVAAANFENNNKLLRRIF